MARVLAVVLGPIWERALVRLTEQGIERLVLAGAVDERGQAESDNVFESLHRVCLFSRQSHELGRRGPKVNDALDRASCLKNFDGQRNVRD